MISEEGLEFRSRVLQRETLWGVGVSQSWSCLKKKRQRGNLKMSILDANPIVFDHVCVPSTSYFQTNSLAGSEHNSYSKCFGNY